MTLAFADKVHNSKSFQQNGLRPYIEQLATYKDDGQLQVVHTPFWLCEDILRKVSEFRNLKNSNILVLFNLEFIDVLLDTFQVKPTKITFAADAETKLEAAKAMGCKTMTVTYSKKRVEIMPEPKKKFDVVVMNPPYQGATKKNEKTGASAIWQKFVDTAISVCDDNGYVAAVHPAGWRGNGQFEETGKTIRSKQVRYLEIHDMSDGLKTFGASTRYDWYVLQNCNCNESTIVKDQNGKKYDVRLSEMPIVPNCSITDVQNLIAKPHEEKVEVLHSFSAYFSRRLSSEQDKKHKYPCVKYISKDGKVDLYWSSYKNAGHYGQKKVMFCIDSASGGGILVDKQGEYLMSQFVAGIVDHPNVLSSIKTALESDQFKNVMRACQYGKALYNHHVISLFRKNFWKEFI